MLSTIFILCNRARWVPALLFALLLPVHAHAAAPCEIGLDPIWQEADGLRSELEGDSFASAFGTFVQDIEDINTEFQLWREDAEHHRASLCLPHTERVEAFLSRQRTYISKHCDQARSDTNLDAWCAAEYAWLTSEEQNLKAREDNVVNPDSDRINNWGQKLLTKERLAVERAKEMLDPGKLENSFRLYAFAVLKDVQAGRLTSCEALAQMSDALGPKTGSQYGRHLAVMGSVLASEDNPLVIDPHARSVRFTASGFRRRFVGTPGRGLENAPQVRHATAYLMAGAEFGATGATFASYIQDILWHGNLFSGRVPEEHDYLLGIAAGEIGFDLKHHTLSVEDLGSTLRAKLCGQ